MPNEIVILTAEIVAWADSVFKNRTPQAALLKLFEEVGELVRDPSNEAEYADVFIMLLDLANMHDIDVVKAIRGKLTINRNRVWVKSPSGTLQHKGVGETCDSFGLHHEPVRTAYNKGLVDQQNGVAANPYEYVDDVILLKWYMKGYDVSVELEKFVQGDAS